MPVTLKTTAARPMLDADTAADLMTRDPVSIRDVATVGEAVAMLTDHGFSAAPVIDEAGRPVGVLSRSDILVHDREKIDRVEPPPEYYGVDELLLDSGEHLPKGFQVETGDATLVRDIMTPVVFSVTPETSVGSVVEDLVSLKVHRLFVVDESGVLVGVVSSLDVLRRLQS
jgi:CBS domain-containing protein